MVGSKYIEYGEEVKEVFSKGISSLIITEEGRHNRDKRLTMVLEDDSKISIEFIRGEYGDDDYMYVQIHDKDGIQTHRYYS